MGCGVFYYQQAIVFTLNGECAARVRIELEDGEVNFTRGILRRGMNCVQEFTNCDLMENVQAPKRSLTLTLTI